MSATILNFANDLFPASIRTSADCTKCNGTGTWIGSFTKRDGSKVTRPCFACNGTGQIAQVVQSAPVASYGQQKVANSGQVGLDRVHALFTTATGNGLKRPIFRGDKLTVKMAKRHEGVLYVTDTTSDAYLGKVANGVFHASLAATPDTLPQLRLICDDPSTAIAAYGFSRATYDAQGNLISLPCGICARELTDPVSLKRGVGPVCAGRFGLTGAMGNGKE